MSTRTGPLTANTVDLLLRTAFGHQMSVARFEGHCVGDRLAPVHRAIVCYAPTVDILRRAAAAGRTLVIAREHPYFLHGGLIHAYTSEGLLRDDPVVTPPITETDRDLIPTQRLDGDPVVTAKRELIESAGIVVYRHGAAWDQYRPAAQSAALARALGLTPEDETTRSRAVVADLPEGRTMRQLAERARDAIGSRSPRVVGDPDHVARRVVVIAGETDPKESFADLLAADPAIDGIIAGAGGILDEVDGGIAYFLDVVASGRPIAMLTVGFGPSHEPGVQEMAKAVAAAVPDLEVEYWPSNDASWIPA